MGQVYYVLLLLICCLFLWMSGYANATGLNECCQEAGISDICNNTCLELMDDFTTSSAATSTHIRALSSACSPTYSTFWLCINRALSTIDPTVNHTENATAQPPPSIYIQCCNISTMQSCQEECIEHFMKPNGDFTSTIGLLSGPCGTTIADPFWQCLLSTATPPPPKPITDADWARVQCCYKAKDIHCKDICLDLYSSQVSTSLWTTFQLDCIHRPDEHSLSTCLADVTSPCQLGCSGMQFCKNFNNRPYQPFRECTTADDRLAKSAYDTWGRTGVILHPLVTLFVDNVRGCLPESWKAVSCIFHLQPCHPTTHATQICREDCLMLLTQCTNSSEIPESVCDIIAPNSSNSHCISIGKFLQPSIYGNDAISPISGMIDNPCDPNPCKEGFFCAINRMCTNNDEGCTSYECQPGCVVGTKPNMILPKSRSLRVSLVPNSDNRCFGYINCSVSRDNGVPRTNPINAHCEVRQSCTSHNGSSYDHQSKFRFGCNFCTCHFGRIICTNRSCIENDTILSSDCGCSKEYAPVCTLDGMTISNECRAQCFGYSIGEYYRGRCGSVNPCYNLVSPCITGSRCIPQRQNCIYNNLTVCQQYTCESFDPGSCERKPFPICDTSHNQHNNLCSFLRTRDEFSYYGYCKSECRMTADSLVCGVNGETFASECHAHNFHILIDYPGSCHSSPGSGPDELSCDGVECPPLLYYGCRSSTLWGACCPVCGTVVTLLIDKTVLQDNMYFSGRQNLTTNDVIKRLENYITCIQCELYGHVAIDGSLTAIVVPSKKFTITPLMVEVCHQEAVRLATFINNQAPMIASDPILSHFIAAEISESTVRNEPTGTVTAPTTINSSTIKLIPALLIFVVSFIFNFLN